LVKPGGSKRKDIRYLLGNCVGVVWKLFRLFWWLLWFEKIYSCLPGCGPGLFLLPLQSFINSSHELEEA
jgi:hypothetical protein